MHKRSIDLLFKTNLWKKIKTNDNYHGYRIISTKEDCSGFKELWVIFNPNVLEKDLRLYHSWAFRLIGLMNREYLFEYKRKELHGMEVLVLS